MSDQRKEPAMTTNEKPKILPLHVYTRPYSGAYDVVLPDGRKMYGFS